MSAKKAKEAQQAAEEQEKQDLEETPQAGDSQEDGAGQETAGAEDASKAAKAKAKEDKKKKKETDPVEELQAKVDDLNDKLMRTLAEYDNYRKRSQRERMEVYPNAVAATVEKFLPVVDNFERAMQSECTDAEFKKGVDMIYHSLMETLGGLGVKEIEAEGKEFDPNFHNAVLHVEDDSLGENVVAQVMQKGYQIGDKVLRHAMVQVAN